MPKMNKQASRKDNMIIDEGLIDYNSDDVNKSLKNH